MAYAVLADYNGEISLTIFPKPWAELKDKLEEDAIFALKGKIKNDSYSNKPVFYVDSLVNLEKLKKKTGGKRHQDEKTSTSCPEFHIRLHESAAKSEETLYSLRNIFVENPGPTVVYIHVPVPLEDNSQGEMVIRTASQIQTSSTALELQRWPEIAQVWEQ
jgi:DNA polymerase III alpha subunit